MRNKEELVSYIASFNKEPGQYTLEETLNIGVAMRTLPKNLISWPWLRDYLGITDCSSEAYRARVSKYIKQNNISIGKEIVSNDVIKEAFASKIQGREWYNAYRRLVREETRIDDLYEFLLDLIEKKEIVFQPYSDKSSAKIYNHIKSRIEMFKTYKDKNSAPYKFCMEKFPEILKEVERNNEKDRQ